MEKELKKAVKSAVLSAGAFSEQFENNLTSYPPHLPSGIKSLKRQNRQDLIPRLKCLINKSHKYDVSSLYIAQLVVSDI